MAQCRAGLLFDKTNIVPVCVGFQGAPRCTLLPCFQAPEPGWGGAAESLAHHEVVGKREKESEPGRGGTHSATFRRS
jgi:hypothetical protein